MITHDQAKIINNLVDTIHGEINRMCVTHELTELDVMCRHAKGNLDKLSTIIYNARFLAEGGRDEN